MTTIRCFALPLGQHARVLSPMQRIDSTHSTWLFDHERMRFRRVPRGVDISTPSLESEWSPYFALELDPETGAFTVALNEDCTRLLRAWRDDVLPNGTAGSEDSTEELRLQPEDSSNSH